MNLLLFIMGISFVNIMEWSPSPSQRKVRTFCSTCSNHPTAGPGPVVTGLVGSRGCSVLPGPKENPAHFSPLRTRLDSVPEHKAGNEPLLSGRVGWNSGGCSTSLVGV